VEANAPAALVTALQRSLHRDAWSRVHVMAVQNTALYTLGYFCFRQAKKSRRHAVVGSLVVDVGGVDAILAVLQSSLSVSDQDGPNGKIRDTHVVQQGVYALWALTLLEDTKTSAAIVDADGAAVAHAAHEHLKRAHHSSALRYSTRLCEKLCLLTLKEEGPAHSEQSTIKSHSAAITDYARPDINIQRFHSSITEEGSRNTCRYKNVGSCQSTLQWITSTPPAQIMMILRQRPQKFELNALMAALRAQIIPEEIGPERQVSSLILSEGLRAIGDLCRPFKSDSTRVLVGQKQAECQKNATAIQQLGGIKLVMDAIKTYADVDYVQHRGCYALSSLAFTWARNIEHAGGIRLLLALMERHAANWDIQEQACAALGVMSFGRTATQKNIVAENGLEAVLRALMTHANKCIVQERGLNALHNLLYRMEPNIAKFVRLGGIATVLGALRAYSAHLMIQRWGCGILGLLADNNNSNVTVITGLGGDVLIVAALERLPSLRAYQACILARKTICHMLQNESPADKTKQNYRHQNPEDDDEPASTTADNFLCNMLENDLVWKSDVLEVLDTHPGNTRIQSMCLQKLADRLLDMIVLLKADPTQNISNISYDSIQVLKAVIRVIQMNSDSTELLCEAYLCMSSFVQSHAPIGLQIKQLSGVAAILTTMEQHSDCVLLQKRGCHFFSLLTSCMPLVEDKYCKFALEDVTIINAITTAMRLFPICTSLQAQGCQALSNYLESSKSVVNGVSPVLDAPQQTRKQELLAKLLAKRPDPTCLKLNPDRALSGPVTVGDCHASIMRAEGLQLALDAMRNHAAPINTCTRDLQMESCRLVGALGCDQQTIQDLIVEAGGLQLILAAMQSHSVNRESVGVPIQCCHTLCLLACTNAQVKSKLLELNGPEICKVTMGLNSVSEPLQLMCGRTIHFICRENATDIPRAIPSVDGREHQPAPTRMCSHWQGGFCVYGDQCVYAHSGQSSGQCVYWEPVYCGHSNQCSYFHSADGNKTPVATTTNRQVEKAKCDGLQPEEGEIIELGELEMAPAVGRNSVATATAMVPPGNMPCNLPPGNMPPGNTPPGNMPPGNIPPGNIPPGNLPPGNMHGNRKRESASEPDVARTASNPSKKRRWPGYKPIPVSNALRRPQT
jgi:hypothetical protein